MEATYCLQNFLKNIWLGNAQRANMFSVRESQFFKNYFTVSSLQHNDERSLLD